MPHQFDIVENRNVRTRAEFPFLVVLQSDQVASFSSLIAAPLAPLSGGFSNSRIHPIVELAGAKHVLLTERLAAVQISTLGRVVDSCETSRYEITAALDMLFTGI